MSTAAALWSAPTGHTWSPAWASTNTCCSTFSRITSWSCRTASTGPTSPILSSVSLLPHSTEDPKQTQGGGKETQVWKLLQMWWHEELAEGQFSSPPMVPMGSWWMELCGFFLCLFTFLTNLAVILLGSCFIYLFYLFFYVFLFIFVKIKRFFLSPNKQKQNNFLPDSL